MIGLGAHLEEVLCDGDVAEGQRDRFQAEYIAVLKDALDAPKSYKYKLPLQCLD